MTKFTFITGEELLSDTVLDRIWLFAPVWFEGAGSRIYAVDDLLREENLDLSHTEKTVLMELLTKDIQGIIVKDRNYVHENLEVQDEEAR